jgi:hypothetical protein
MAVGWYVVAPPFVGALDADTKKLIATMNGDNPVQGVLDPEVQKLVATMHGTAPYVGQIVAEAQSALATLAGSQLIPASMAAAVKKALFAAVGAQNIPGNLAVAVQKTLFSGNGMHYNNGTLVAAGQKLVAALNALIYIPGSLAASGTKLSANFSEGMEGVLAVQARKPLASMAGLKSYQGTLAATTKPPTAGMSGLQTFSGQLAAAKAKAAMQASGVHIQSGTLSASKPKVTAAFAGNMVAGVQVRAVGTGARVDTGAKTFNIDHQITVPSGLTNARMYVFVVSGTNLWTAITCSVTSNINGSISSFVSVPYGNNSGWRQGRLEVFELINPSPGTHTLNSLVNSGDFQSLYGILTGAIVVDRVGGTGTPVTQATTGTAGAQSVTIPDAADGDMILVFQAGSGPLTLQGNWPTTSPGLWYNDGRSITGDGDYAYAAYLEGDGSSKTFSGPNTGSKHALAAFRLIKS